MIGDRFITNLLGIIYLQQNCQIVSNYFVLWRQLIIISLYDTNTLFFIIQPSQHFLLFLLELIILLPSYHIVIIYLYCFAEKIEKKSKTLQKITVVLG